MGVFVSPLTDGTTVGFDDGETLGLKLGTDVGFEEGE